MTGTDVVTCSRERPGTSAFVLEDGVVYHTYSSVNGLLTIIPVDWKTLNVGVHGDPTTPRDRGEV